MSAKPVDTPWSAQQREWLQAMGLEVWVPLAADAGEPAALPDGGEGANVGTAAIAPLSARDEAQPPVRSGPGTGQPDAARADHIRPQRTRPDSARSDPGPDREPPLLRALLRAARRDTAAQLAGVLPDDLEALGRDPAAKRALWPRLRALRRSGR